MTTLLTPHQLGALGAGQPPHRKAVFGALGECGGGLVLLRQHHRSAGMPGGAPLIVIVDDGPVAGGPDAFDAWSLRALLGAVDGVVVLCGQPRAWPYERTASLAHRGVSSFLIETTPDHSARWIGFVRAAVSGLPVAFVEE